MVFESNSKRLEIVRKVIGGWPAIAYISWCSLTQVFCNRLGYPVSSLVNGCTTDLSVHPKLFRLPGVNKDDVKERIQYDR